MRSTDALRALGITDTDVERYTYGDCWRLAWDLHQATGWSMVVLTGRVAPRSPSVCDRTLDMWKHVLVVRPDGVFVDVAGAHTRDELLADWNDETSLHLTPEFSTLGEYVEWLNDGLFPDGWEPDNPENYAKTIAPDVLAFLLADAFSLEKRVEGVTANEVTRYTQGDCWLLAWELHKRTSWPIEFLSAPWLEDEDKSIVGCWVHWAVRTPSGELLDVRGLQNDDEVRSHWWGSKEWLPLTKYATPRDFEAYRDTLFGTLEEDVWPENGTRLPSQMADHLLAQVHSS